MGLCRSNSTKKGTMPHREESVLSRLRRSTTSGLRSEKVRGPVSRGGKSMTARQARHAELKQLVAGPNGNDKLYLILTGNFIAFEKLPIGTHLIEAILDHEYPRRK